MELMQRTFILELGMEYQRIEILFRYEQCQRYKRDLVKNFAIKNTDFGLDQKQLVINFFFFTLGDSQIYLLNKNLRQHEQSVSLEYFQNKQINQFITLIFQII